MAILKCKMCGGSLDLIEGSSVIYCEYCGTKQTVPLGDDNKKMNLFVRANRLRFACEFDKAAGIYESILADFPEEAEGYWGLVLCKYGIEYVDDPATAKKVPTCHRSSFESIMDDPDYEQALETADAVARAVYRNEAKQIEEIRKGIIEVSSKEEPYDIFICYKETAEDGQRTIDSVLAQDVYDVLTEKGYRVFFSRITLEEKIGQKYEPYIFAALNSAKIMLAFGTDYEYYNSVWVKNEWSRFLKLMEKDKEKHLIPCYKGIDIYDIPKEFVKLQAQDLGKVGAVQDLVRGIEKLIGTKKQNENVQAVQPVVLQQTKPDCENLLKRAFMFLEDGNWDAADEYCEKVLDIDSENAGAYLGKLMTDLRVKKQEDLKNQTQPFDDNLYYQKVRRFGNAELQRTLKEYIDFINERNENERLEGIYNRGKQLMDVAKTEKAYKKAADVFQTIPGYKDADELLRFAEKKIKELEEERLEREHQAEFARKEAEKQAEAERLERERKAELARKEAEKEAAERARRNKKIAMIVAPIVCVMIGVIIYFTTVVVLNNKYKDALALMDAGKYQEAGVMFEKLGNYKDSEEKSNECDYIEAIALSDAGNVVEAYELFIALEGYKDSTELANEIHEKYRFQFIKEGDSVTFGCYEQDDDTENGKEEVEWIVLEVKDEKALLLSKYGLDSQPYNKILEEVTWETCTLRSWLNDNFLNTAFSEKEKSMIQTVTVSADKDPEFNADPGNATQDRIFLLSIKEVNKYLNNGVLCEATNYARGKGVYGSNSNGACYWWMRSPGYRQIEATMISPTYDDNMVIEVYDERVAVRPAMWIDLSTDIF